MNPIQPLFVLLCVAFLLGILLTFEMFIFRLACLLCKVPQPSLLRTIGMVSILLAIPAILDAALGAGFIEIYKNSGYPLWEAGLVQFFLALPIHMIVCALIHAKMMKLRLGESLAVWFVEKLLKLILLLLALGGVAVILLVSNNK